MKLFKNIIIVLIFLNVASPPFTYSQIGVARNGIERIFEYAKGRVGVAVININSGDTLTVNGNGKFPMQSVFKFPLALAVLHQVDLGKFTLDQKIHLKKSDLLPDTWSPLREKYPNGDVDVTLDELLSLTVSLSDNNGCDILFRLLGGPQEVEQYIRNLGVEEMAIVANEEEMHKDWNVQYRNWSSPYAMAQLLRMFYRDSILSRKSTEYLWNIMVKTVTGKARLKGKLPEGTVVGHKTGSSGKNSKGITAATNDVGIVILPDGTPVVIIVFVSDSAADEKTRDAVIADIAKALWDASVYP